VFLQGPANCDSSEERRRAEIGEDHCGQGGINGLTLKGHANAWPFSLLLSECRLVRVSCRSAVMAGSDLAAGIDRRKPVLICSNRGDPTGDTAQSTVD